MAVRTTKKKDLTTWPRVNLLPGKRIMRLGDMRCMVLPGDVQEFLENGYEDVGQYHEGKQSREVA